MLLRHLVSSLCCAWCICSRLFVVVFFESYRRTLCPLIWRRFGGRGSRSSCSGIVDTSYGSNRLQMKLGQVLFRSRRLEAPLTD